MIRIYTYVKCSTCVKAVKYLESKKLEFEQISIIDQPPTQAELKAMTDFLKARGGSFKNLFNTSGEQYRALKISEKLKSGMTESEATLLLSTHGKLIKRPFLVIGSSSKLADGTVGFQPELWSELLGS